MSKPPAQPAHPPTACRVCGGTVSAFLDLGQQPLSDAFRKPDETTEEFFFPLVVGNCRDCSMTQLLYEVPREKMFHAEYPYRSSGSTTMTAHFTEIAERLLAQELRGTDPFIVEIGSNDGVMLRTVAAAGVRHLGVDPSSGVGLTARQAGVRMRDDFSRSQRHETSPPPKAVRTSSTRQTPLCHIPYLDSMFAGIDALLRPDGIFMFEDPYIGDILDRRSFDQIYDEHFYFFSATSVRAMALRFGFELINVERLEVHGGEVRYTLARQGCRQPDPGVTALLDTEARRGLAGPEPYERFARDVYAIREDLRRVGRSA